MDALQAHSSARGGGTRRRGRRGRRPPAAARHPRRQRRAVRDRSPSWSTAGRRPRCATCWSWSRPAPRCRSTRSSRRPSIAQRFSTGAMSHGSLSAEAHETLAEAMNLLGGRSNCGEGGEDPYRFRTRGQASGDKNSRIKQIASGRFGVTPEYCAYADELQIKMAQGSKPGEGGQLPGHKVSEEIARLRHTQPGRHADLAAAPPRHLLDRGPGPAHLRPEAGQRLRRRVGEAGRRGRRRDHRRRRGQGAGRGGPDQRGQRRHRRLAAVVHQARRHAVGARPGRHPDRPRSTTACGTGCGFGSTAGFMTGRDVIIAALLGADEFSFGTAAMIAEGCILLRACHRDTCTTGIATQRPHLRAKFAGTPGGRGRLPAVRRRGGPPAPGRARAAIAGRGHRPGRVPPPAFARQPAGRQHGPAPAAAAPGRSGRPASLCRRRAHPAMPLVTGRPAAGRRLPAGLGRRAHRAGLRHQQPGPHRGRGAGRGPRARVRHQAAARAGIGPLRRCGRPELRRVHHRRRPPRAGRRGQRLRRQGHGRRPAS